MVATENTNNSFEVIVRRKVPYLTSFLFHLLVVFGIILIIIDVLFLPTRDASNEMKVAYFILVMPEFVKKALFISGIGFVTVLPFYVVARLYKKATITFLPELITIEGKDINIRIPLNTIARVYCMDAKTISGMPRDKLTIYFELKKEKTIRVRLKYYVQSEEFMNRLLQYGDLNFRTYDFDVSPSIENEE